MNEKALQRLLLAYPADYRRTHGAELVGTLLEASPPDRRLPTARETFGLLRGGLRARLQLLTTHPAPWQLDGLHLGVFVLTLRLLTTSVLYFGTWLGVPVAILAVLAGWRGRVRWALALTVLAALLNTRPLPEFMTIEHLGLVQRLPYLAPVLGFLLLVALTGRNRLRRRSWFWWALPATIVIGRWELWWTTQVLLFVLIIGALALTVVLRDGRWALAVAVYNLGGIAPLAVVSMYGPVGFDPVFWSIALGLIVIPLALAAIVPRTRRRLDA